MSRVSQLIRIAYLRLNRGVGVSAEGVGVGVPARACVGDGVGDGDVGGGQGGAEGGGGVEGLRFEGGGGWEWG